MKGQLVHDHICAGLELEYEGVSHETTARHLNEAGDTLWVSTRDGSLRPQNRNTELKFAGPLSGDTILQALDTLQVLKDLRYQCTWRCGMHVHIDYTGALYRVVHNTFLLSALIEPLLFAWGGPSRVESKFCHTTTQGAFSFIKPGNKLATRKYTAVNLSNVDGGIRTVEFRYADSTTDSERMLSYINLNMGLRLIAEQFPDGWSLIDSALSASSLADWLAAVSPDETAKLLIPLAKEQQGSYPWDRIMPAATALAEHHDTLGHLATNIVGGGKQRTPGISRSRAGATLAEMIAEEGRRLRERAAEVQPEAVTWTTLTNATTGT